ncbi:MAG: hypothetical protein ACKUBY_00370 [Candidatus Moraniibacteriota bacterium]|jgi:thymidylate kinase
MRIISISGLDGSGKSTQIQLLQEYFENNNKKVFYFHAVEFSIANRLSLRGGTTKQSPSAIDNSTEIATSLNAPRNDNTNITKASWLKIQLRKIALLIDIFRFKSLVKKLDQDNYNYILTDRYFYDMIVNITYLSKKDYKPFFLSKITVPNYKFHLSVEPDNIMNRSNPPSQGFQYLQDKKELFEKYKSDFELKEIDGNREKEVIFEEIKNYII